VPEATVLAAVLGGLNGGGSTVSSAAAAAAAAAKSLRRSLNCGEAPASADGQLRASGRKSRTSCSIVCTSLQRLTSAASGRTDRET
jgi:hypothetical protein